MDAERWAQIKTIFSAAAARPADERPAFIRSQCNGDESLAAEVESLLAAHDRAGSFIEAFPVDETAVALAGEAASRQPALVGRTVGHYEVLSALGAGGMGEVYLAEDTRLSRKVAIKFLPEGLAVNEQARRRFLREARAAATLDHPNICAIYEVGEVDGHTFIVMQHIEGETLADKIRRQPPELSEALAIAVQVADALAEAHLRRVIHRDIKPQNVMITARGQVKVLDFGLAKVIPEGLSVEAEAETESALSEPGLILGTVPYMSPEQVRGEVLDARTDVFSFGALLYEMVSGRQPFKAESTATTISAILSKEPAPLARFSPEVPAELERIVAKALRKDRRERYQGIKDLALDLKDLKEQLDFEARLERSKSPGEEGGGGGVSTAGNRATAVTSPDLPASARETGGSKAGSSTRPLTGAILRHRRAAVGALALALTVSAAAYLYFSNFDRGQGLTEKDTILLADIVNTTGDAVFDGTLKQGLEVQLGQSPFFNIFPEQRVRETLRRMERSPDERVTKEVGREICQREGIKALFVGSIASLGSHYVITLETLNSQTGEALAREQVEAEGKERVISKLGEAATKMREKLGESLASIQKFDTPLAEATTSSLEALKAFTLGAELSRRGKHVEAMPFFKRAVELDPDFALAYVGLAVTYYSEPIQSGESERYAAKAFELRERATERERYRISSLYYFFVTHELDKQTEVIELWTQTYPHYATARNDLAVVYLAVGQYEKAVEQASEAIRLDPNAVVHYSNLGRAYRALGRYDEAKATFEQARARNLDYLVMHWNAYLIAFAEGDQAEMQRQLQWASGKPSEFSFLNLQRWTEMFAGRYRQSRETARRAVESAQSRELQDSAAEIMATSAVWEALVGNCQQARAETVKALATARGAEPPVVAALASALCGDAARAQSIIDDLTRRYPQGTGVNAIWGPVVRAAAATDRADPTEAIRLLQKAKPYEMGQEAGFWPTYMRGQAYLRQGSAAEAMAEFQKIIDRRSIAPADPLYPLAHLGLARGAALVGDTAKSRKAYEDFFALWKDADADLPILLAAKKEYEKVR